MTPHLQRPAPHAATADAERGPDTTEIDAPFDGGFDPVQWQESEAEAGDRGAGGRRVLAAGLIALSVLWLAYTAWLAGRALASEPLASPQVAQWIAIAAGPLALLGLGWLMFGRTRRREAERFTRSVVAMRAEARSLEALLAVLSTRLHESQDALGQMAERLMGLGDEATQRMGSAARELQSSSDLLTRQGQALDRAADQARTDFGVLLADLPRAEESARLLTEQLRGASHEAVTRTAEYGEQVRAVSERTREADAAVAEASERLVAHLAQIESAGSGAASRVGEAEASFSTALDALLDRTSRSLDEIRNGLDAQSAAVLALVDQASSGLDRAGSDAADALGRSIGNAGASLDNLTARIAEQERASQGMFAEVDRGLSLIDQRFAELAAHGDERANHFLGSLGRARAELDALAEQASTQDGSIESLAERTAALRAGIDQLSADLRDNLGAAIGDAEGGAQRMLDVARTAKPEIDWMRDAAVEASDRLQSSGRSIAEQQDRFTTLLASLDEGVGGAQDRLAALNASLADAQSEAARLTAETGPALVGALVQVREAAAHAADRARQAIAEVIPESAAALSNETRAALERAIREGIEDRLAEVEQVAARAVESARVASDRLTHQMLTLGQSASALEQHMEASSTAQRERDTEAFARRVSLLMDSMNSAAIDVGKILSDEVDEKAWESYLKGNRGVFTRRAVRLLDGGETRAIREQYDADAEFQQSVNRYVHDFEAMLRRILAERDGGMIAVTLMSSDIGKLYAALAQAVDRRR